MELELMEAWARQIRDGIRALRPREQFTMPMARELVGKIVMFVLLTR